MFNRECVWWRARGYGVDGWMRAMVLAAVTPWTFSSTCSAAEIVRFDFENVVSRRGYAELPLWERRIGMTIRHRNILFAVNRRVDEPKFNAAFGFQALSAFNGAGGPLDPGPFLVDFATPIRGLSVEMGDFGEDTDLLLLEAYTGPNGSGALVDRDVVMLPGTEEIFSYETLSVHGPSIRSVVMIGGSPTFPNSVFYDNLTVIWVPEPTSGWLGLVAMIVYVGTGGHCATRVGKRSIPRSRRWSNSG